MDLNNHIVKPDDDKPFHSNGYAVVAQGNQIGSTASISFEQRQLIDRNRKIIDNYHRSAIGGTYGALRAKPVAEHQIDRSTIRRGQSLGQRPGLSSQKRFSEPQSRTYNPYA